LNILPNGYLSPPVIILPRFLNHLSLPILLLFQFLIPFMLLFFHSS
jgi:hypothetical protein